MVKKHIDDLKLRIERLEANPGYCGCHSGSVANVHVQVVTPYLLL